MSDCGPGSDRTDRELKALLDGPLHGEVSGVRFDLQPVGLDLADWTAGELPENLVLPWEDWDPRAEMLAGEVLPFPVITVAAGDKVFIRELVWNQPAEDALQDKYDASEVHGLLSIQRASGPVDTPLTLTFARRDAVRAWSPHQLSGHDPAVQSQRTAFGITYAKVSARGRRMASSIDRGSGGLVVSRDPENSQLIALAAELSAKLDVMLEGLGPDQRSSAMQIADMAGAIGFAVGRADAASRLEPWAKRGLKAHAVLERATAKARQANTKNKRALLLRDAEQMCAADHNLSLTGCARVLGGRHDMEPSNVRPIIRPLFDCRILSSGKREYRPKRPG